MTEITRDRLYLQSSINKNKWNYWQSLHNKLQYILTIHKEQGNKTSIFPFDLAYFVTNRWNAEEKNSYKIICNTTDFEINENKNNMIKDNLNILKETREKIHNRLQYLLDIHIDISKPFPLDLVYMMDLDTHYFFEALKYDKEYIYDRKLTPPYYNGPVFYMTGLLDRQNKSLDQFKFFDIENKYFNIDELKCYIKSEFKVDSVSEDYLLWKAANYDYNRLYSDSYYNPDNYLSDNPSEALDNCGYGELDDDIDIEPIYTSFNHFTNSELYDDFYDTAV